MTRRRRSTIDRSPFSRVELWDRKMNGKVYSIYLQNVKPLALRKFTEYQIVHEELIKIVKETLSKYPQEISREHSYMWYIQGIWYVIQRYTDEARQKEVDALYMYWLLLGLNDEILRELAMRLGVKISSIETILGKVGVSLGVSVDTIYQGTKKALQETLHGVDVNPIDVTYSYDPTTGNISEITIIDKITKRKKTIKLYYDSEGRLIRKVEFWG